LIKDINNFTTLESDDAKLLSAYRAGIALRTANSAAVVARITAQWDLTQAESEGDALKVLTDATALSDQETLAGPAAVPSTQALTISSQDLAKLVKDLDALAESPGLKARLETLVNFAKTTNEKLTALQKKADGSGGAGP
jgi:hypothetical protein